MAAPLLGDIWFWGRPKTSWTQWTSDPPSLYYCRIQPWTWIPFHAIFTLLLFHPAFLTQRNNGTILPAQLPSSAQENHSAIEQHPLIVPIRWDDWAEGMIQSIHWHSIIFFCTRLLLCYGSTATRGYLFLRTTEESLYLNPVFSTRDTLQHY